MNLSIGDRVFVRADERRVTGFSDGGALVRLQSEDGYEGWFGAEAIFPAPRQWLYPEDEYTASKSLPGDLVRALGWTAPT